MRDLNVLCLDLGGTALKSAIVRSGKATRRAEVGTDISRGINSIRETFEKCLAQYPPEEYDAVALSSAGEVDGERKKITYATDLLPGYTGFDLGEFFSEKTKKPFECLNDGRAALLGECRARGLSDGTVAMLTLGTGAGGGIVSCKEPSEYPDAVPFGHLTLVENGRKCTCGKRGCVEEYVSGSALTRGLRRAGIVCSKEELWARYDAGDRSVRGAVGKWLERLRKACDLIYGRYPFQLMIFGGGVSESGGSWFKDFEQSARYRTELSVLGNDAGMLGAYSFFCERTSRKRIPDGNPN